MNEHLSRTGAALLGGAVVFGAAGATSTLTATGGWSNPVVIGLLIAAALCVVGALWAFGAARAESDRAGAGRVPPGHQADESTPDSGTAASFGEAWGKMTLPVRAQIGVIDNSDVLELGLSATQLDNIGHTGKYDAVVVSFVDTRIRAQIYNAFGMQAMEGAEVRISSGLAKRLDCHVGDEILIEGLAAMSG